MTIRERKGKIIWFFQRYAWVGAGIGILGEIIKISTVLKLYRKHKIYIALTILMVIFQW